MAQSVAPPPGAMGRLASLAPEAVDNIFSYLDINTIVQLFTSSNGDALVGNLYRYLQKTPLLVTNRTRTYTNLIMYVLTPSHLRKNLLHLLSQSNLPILLSLLDTFKLSISPITISYHIWDLLDLREFLEVVKLAKSTHGRFNVELELDSGLRNVINMAHVVNQFKLDDFNTKISMFLLTHYQLPFNYNPKEFPALTHFWLAGCHINVNPTEFEASSLQNYHCSPNFWDYNTGPSNVIKTLPSSINTLFFYDVTIHKHFLSPKLPQLQKLSLSNIKDFTNGEFILRLLEANLPSTLRELVLKDLFEVSMEKHTRIFDFVSQNLDNLNLVSLTGSRKWPGVSKLLETKAPTLQKLELSFPTLTPESFTSVGLLDHLTKLNLCNCNLEDVNDIPMSPYLVELYLSYNPINWETYDLKLPNTLKRFEIKHTLLKRLHVLKLPDSIETLGLEVNLLESIDNYKFPANLKALGLGSNSIKSIRNHILPPGLIIIHLTENEIKGPIDFSTNIWGQKLNLFAIYLNHNKLTSLSQMKFPPSLHIINVDGNQIRAIKNVKFNPELQELSMKGCHLKKFEVKFPNLKTLNLSQNSLETVPSLPESIENLSLSFNKIQELEEHAFYNCLQLKHLHLDQNWLKLVNLDLPGLLQMLDLSYNMIDFLHLKFHDLENGKTKLTSLSISSNHLSSFTPQMINLSLHNLEELDICGNIRIDRKLLNLSQFPVNTFIFGLSGKKDEFDNDIGTNLIENSNCYGKRMG